MNKVKKVNLDVNELSSLIKSLRTLSTDLNDLPKKITKEIADIGQDFLEDQYANTRTDHTIDIDTISTEVVEKSNGYQIIASGEELLYAEFGTGEEGLDNPHPRKQEFDLNPYNSGPTIRLNQATGRHYWIYNGTYSEGNPSGAEVFNTARFLREKGIKDISKKKVSDVLSKV